MLPRLCMDLLKTDGNTGCLPLLLILDHHLFFYFLRKLVLLSLEFTDLARLDGYQAPDVYLSVPKHWACSCPLGCRECKLRSSSIGGSHFPR